MTDEAAIERMGEFCKLLRTKFGATRWTIGEGFDEHSDPYHEVKNDDAGKLMAQLFDWTAFPFDAADRAVAAQFFADCLNTLPDLFARGRVDSLRVALGNLEIKPVRNHGGSSTRGYGVFVNGVSVSARSVKVSGSLDNLWEVELEFLSGAVQGENGDQGFTTMRRGEAAASGEEKDCDQ